MSTPVADIPDWARAQIEDKRPFGRGLGLIGFAIIAFFFGSFYVWASAAPIEGAVLAPGVINVDTNVRNVQHLEGGIVDQILVREGDRVETGQVLIRLQNTVSASSRNEIQAQYFEARAAEARLIAEQSGADEITFPDELKQKFGDQAVRAAMDGQRGILQNRRDLLTERASITERIKDGLASEITGLEGQIMFSEQRVALISEELADVEALLAMNLTNRPRLLGLQRDKAELEGGISGYRAAIGTARQNIQQAELRFAELQAEMASEVTEQVQRARALAYELGQQLNAAQDVVGRTEIRSPVAGIVTGLNVHTVGGVIAAGQTLLDVVPVSDKLVVLATIDPLDIDQVAPGLPAQVWLAALNRRSEAPLTGIVTTVSADRIIDPTTGAAYYSARVELDRDDAARGSVPLQPGMSAEVAIRTGARSVMDYISTPITRFLSRGLREG